MTFFYSLPLFKFISRYREKIYLTGYTLFFISWFFHDVSSSYFDVYLIGKILRLLSYILFFLELPFVKRSKREWLCFMCFILLSLYVVILSREVFFLIFTLLIFLSIDIDIKKILKTSFVLLGFSSALIVIFSFFGITNNIISPRLIGGDNRVRNSFGFYHSNVLPLNLFYLVCYYTLIKKKQSSYSILMILFFTCALVYYFCLSRNSFVLSTVLILSVILFKVHRPSLLVLNFIKKLASHIILALTVLSLILIILFFFKIDMMNYIDVYLFSGRINYSLQKIMSIGISFFTPLSYSEYANDLIVVDNGYISTLVRYSLLTLICLCFFNFKGIEKQKNNEYVLLTIIMIGIANFFDNDIFSYSCFILWIAVFNKNTNQLRKMLDQQLDFNPKISVIMSVYNEKREELTNSMSQMFQKTMH